jgi:phage FluMu protein gp41
LSKVAKAQMPLSMRRLERFTTKVVWRFETAAHTLDSAGRDRDLQAARRAAHALRLRID